MAQYAFGVDIGGTSAKTGIVEATGKVVYRGVPISTSNLRSGDELVAGLDAALNEALSDTNLSRSDLVGIGIGCPGPLDLDNGLVLETPNLAQLNGYALRDRLAEKTGQAVWLDNDANVYALGEARFGRGRGHDIVVGVTLGTGLGWGIIFNGQVYHGATGTAAEYALVPWHDDSRTWESHISISGLMRTFRSLGGQAADPREVSEQAAQGDRTAREAWRQYGKVLGMALSHVVCLIDPHVVVLGGSMSQAWEHFSPQLLETLNQHIFAKSREQLQVVPTELGSEAPLLGAVSQALFS